MSALAHIQKGRTLMPRRVMLYGVHGVGKSTFGAMAETPVFITTEEGTNDIDCDRFPLATKYADVLGALSALYSEDHGYQTVVIDSLDWLERLIWAEVCAKRGVETIDRIADGSRGRGRYGGAILPGCVDGGGEIGVGHVRRSRIHSAAD